jgi:hypothetical protein
MASLPTALTFAHQDLQDPVQSSLCAYFAAYHFLYGSLTRPAFLSQAATFYAQELGMNRTDARQLAESGNDPALVEFLLKNQAESTTRALTSTDLSYYNRVLLALKNQAHFLTILKDTRGQWWNYDSLQAAPARIGDVAQFLVDNPAREYFLAK